ncbi:MAG TPA: hypothetical protein VI636_02765, partial [Candidatus Angelobacter sp.]
MLLKALVIPSAARNLLFKLPNAKLLNYQMSSPWFSSARLCALCGEGVGLAFQLLLQGSCHSQRCQESAFKLPNTKLLNYQMSSPWFSSARLCALCGEGVGVAFPIVAARLLSFPALPGICFQITQYQITQLSNVFTMVFL